MSYRWMMVLFLSGNLLFPAGCGGRKAVEEPPASALPEHEKKEATLKDLNDALVVWLMRNPDFPASVDEMAAAPWFDKKLPPLPPGKKFVIDRRRQQVFLVDE